MNNAPPSAAHPAGTPAAYATGTPHPHVAPPHLAAHAAGTPHPPAAYRVRHPTPQAHSSGLGGMLLLLAVLVCGGAVGFIIWRRMDDDDDGGGGSPTPPGPPKPSEDGDYQDCVMSEWTGLNQSCVEKDPKTSKERDVKCGDNAYKRRTRFVITHPGRFGKKCGDLEELTPCPCDGCPYESVPQPADCVGITSNTAGCDPNQKGQRTIVYNLDLTMPHRTNCPAQTPARKEDCNLPVCCTVGEWVDMKSTQCDDAHRTDVEKGKCKPEYINERKLSGPHCDLPLAQGGVAKKDWNGSQGTEFDTAKPCPDPNCDALIEAQCKEDRQNILTGVHIDEGSCHSYLKGMHVDALLEGAGKEGDKWNMYGARWRDGYCKIGERIGAPLKGKCDDYKQEIDWTGTSVWIKSK